MTDTNIKLKRITIKTETGSKWFDDPVKLASWIREQKSLYKPLNAISQKYGTHALFHNFENLWTALEQLAIKLPALQTNEDAYNSTATRWSSQFQQYLSQNQIFTSDATFSDFLVRQSKINPAYGIAVLTKQFSINLTGIDGALLEGVIQVNEYEKGSTGRLSDEENSLEKIHLKWDQKLSNLNSNW